MKISLEWLKDYLPGALDPHAAGEALTHGGLPVEVFEKHGDDDVIDVEVTSNRGDCLSHLGVARELGALLDRPHHAPKIELTESAEKSAAVTSVTIEATKQCPFYAARIIRGVRIGPSPAWMVRRLEAVGIRPINNVVDVTNYVMFELGQPLHAFDFDKLAGKRIVVRMARTGEKLITLDGREQALTPEMLTIADAEKPVALAGIMGGQHSEVTAGTTNILLESARFDPLVIRKTARALAMKSESSYRFERGLPKTLQTIAADRAAQLIVQLAGGQILGGIVHAGETPGPPRTLSLRPAKLRSVLGVELPPVDVVKALTRLGFTPEKSADGVGVQIPPWRLDINQEIDLVEEVARVIGYDRIPTRDEISVRLHKPDPAAAATEKIRQTLIAAGYFEAITFSFVSDALADSFQPKDAAGLPRADAAVRKADARLRPSILPGLLEAVLRNEHAGTSDARLFEIGSTFWTDAAGNIVERRQLGLVGSEDLRDIRGTVEELLARLDSNRPIRIIPDQRAGFAPGACGRIEWGDSTLGYLGRVDRAVQSKLSLRGLPCAAELDVEPLLAGARAVPTLHPLPKFPAVERDLSLILAENVPYDKIASLIASLKTPNLEDAEFVTTYRGKPLEKGQKSVTMKLIFRAADRTLTGEEVDASVKKIVEAAANQLNATLRA